MAHYVVGDVQGCFKELEALLKKIKFNFNKDILIFAGDLVNRGDASEKVLEFCIKKKDKSLKKVLESKNIKKYQAWLRKQPLLLDIKIKESNEIFWISHAGIPFIWQADEAKKFSKEIQVALKNDSSNLLKNIWGDTPKIWNPNLRGYKRQRTIINYFTRMRFLSKDGSLRLNLKSGKGKKGYIPWYKQTIDNLKDNENIVFGHWASLEGKTGLKNIIGLDTGCVWGNKLTAIRLEDRKLFQIKKK